MTNPSPSPETRSGAPAWLVALLAIFILATAGLGYAFYRLAEQCRSQRDALEQSRKETTDVRWDFANSRVHLERQLRDAKAESAARAAELRKALAAIDELTASLEKANAERTRLGDALEHTRARIDFVESQASQAEAKLAALQEKLERAVAVINQQRYEAAASDDHLAVLQSKLDVANRQIEELQAAQKPKK